MTAELHDFALMVFQNSKVLPFFNIQIPHGIIAKTVSS